MDILTDVRNDVIRVYRIENLPDKMIFALAFRALHQSSISYPHQIFRSSDCQGHSHIWLIAPIFFYWKPYARPYTFTGYGHPRISFFILCENPAAIPRRIFSDGRISAKIYFQGMRLPFFKTLFCF